MYLPNIDFHVGSIEEFISKRVSESDRPFLDHAILDLPDAHHYFEILAKALKPNGTLITWCPSITQVNKCVTLVKAQRMLFLLDKVIESGNGSREWDVTPVKPRALWKSQDPHIAASDKEVLKAISKPKEGHSLLEGTVSNDDGWEMVCCPKRGIRVVGGGFIAVWQKMKDQNLEPKATAIPDDKVEN